MARSNNRVDVERGFVAVEFSGGESNSRETLLCARYVCEQTCEFYIILLVQKSFKEAESTPF